MYKTICLSEILTDSTKEIFETMIFMEIEECPDPAMEIEGKNFVGTISFKDGISGFLAITCGEQCAKSIAISMLGFDPDDDISDGDIRDAIGEVTNMVMGCIKTRIQQDSNHIQVSIPVVTTGQHLEQSLGENSNCETVRICTDEGELIKLALVYKEQSEEK